MPGPCQCRVVAAIAGYVLLMAPAYSQGRMATKGFACRSEASFTATVAAAIDGRTLVLSDGREVRLAMIESPPLARPLAGPLAHGDAGLPGARAAHAALLALVAGREVSVAPLTPASDRYGRVLARAYLSRDGRSRSLEAELVATGHAFVSPFAGDRACGADLRAAEGKARAEKLGLWGDPYYEIKQADDPAAVLAARGRFTIVEGRVVSVRESGGTVYVNFGRRWSEDFTVTILKRSLRLFAAAGLEPRTLAGRRVLARGVIEERGGPWIEARRPEQIDFLDR